MMTVSPASLESVPTIRPRRVEMSPITAPAYSSPTVTSRFAIGSSRMGLAFSHAARKPMRAAVLNAISLESTAWYDPSYTATLMSTMG